MKTFIKIVVGILGIALIGGIGGLFLMQTLVPQLALYPQTKDWAIVKRLQEHTTIIERAEQVEVTQNDLVRDIVGQLRNSIVLVKDTRGTIAERSGIVVTGDGIIAVAGDVRGVDNVQVFLTDGSKLTAKHTVYDVMTGISFITLDATRDYTPLSFARAEDLFVGQYLVDIGVDESIVGAVYAFGTQMQSFIIGNTATPMTAQTWEGFIQAQTAQRQAGSILVTNRGELAGLVSVTRDGAVRIMPSSAVTHALWRLLHKRSAVVPNLGVTYHVVTPITTADSVQRNGVVVENVAHGSRGAIAGLRRGDQIVRVDEENLSPYRTLPVLLDTKYDAAEITLTVLRAGEKKRIVISQEKNAHLTGTK